MFNACAREALSSRARSIPAGWRLSMTISSLLLAPVFNPPSEQKMRSISRFHPRLNKGQMTRPCALLMTLLIASVSSTALAQPSRSAISLKPSDYVEIYNLYAKYAMAFDSGDTEARVATFAPDGTMNSFLSKHVPYNMDKMRDMMKSAVRLSHPRVTHMLTNIHITPTADGADGSCYATLILGRASNGHFDYSPAFYRDALVKISGSWRFKSREVWLANEEQPKK